MKIWAIALLCGLVPVTMKAQSRWAVQLSGGVSNYQGDIQDKRFTLQNGKTSFGIGANYDLTPHLQLRGGLTFLKISGDDKESQKPDLIKRNLNFASNIAEGHVGIEYHILDLSRHRLSPYLFTGVAVFHFNPYTYDSVNQKHYLQPLRTEGQGLTGNENNSPYKKTQLSIPLGIGIRWAISDKIAIGYEIGFRKTFTDYLDDVSTNYASSSVLLSEVGPKAVELAYRGGELKNGDPVYPETGSQRGGSRYKDGYYNSMLTLHIRLQNNRGTDYSGKKGRGSLACPRPVW